MSTSVQPAQTMSARDPVWVTFGDADAEPVPPVSAPEPAAVQHATWPDLLPPLEQPETFDGDVRVMWDEPVSVLVTAPESAPPPSSGITSTTYWLNVRAAIAGAVRWPPSLRGATSVVLRMQATPYGCVVLEPSSGPEVNDTVRRAARLASERVARVPGEDVSPQAELAIHFEPYNPTRRSERCSGPAEAWRSRRQSR